MPTDQSVEIEREIFMRSLAPVPTPPSVARQFGRMVQDIEFPPGTRIYERGTAPENLYFILRGSVELAAPGEAPWVFKDDGLFGIMDAVLLRTHTRSATALTSLRVMVIKAADYFELLEDNFEFTRAMLRNLARTNFENNLELAPHGVFVPVSPVSKDPSEECDCGNLIDRIMLMKHTTPFDGMPTQALAILAGEAERVEVRAGQSVFEPGEPSVAAWVVSHGRVALTGVPLTHEFGHHTLVGGHSCLMRGDLPFGARAVVDSTLIRIDLENIFDLMEEQFRVVRAVMTFGARFSEAITLEKKRRERPSESLAS